MGFLNIKAELFKMIYSMRGIDWASHTNKVGVKDEWFRRLQRISC